MFSEKELRNISLDSEEQEFQLNTEKFCNTSKDIKAGLEVAKIIVKNPLVKLLLGLAIAVVEALQNKLQCPPEQENIFTGTTT